MPSRDHELTLELIRRSPSVLERILRDAFGIEVSVELRSGSEAFGEIDPSTYTADARVVARCWSWWRSKSRSPSGRGVRSRRSRTGRSGRS